MQIMCTKAVIPSVSIHLLWDTSGIIQLTRPQWWEAQGILGVPRAPLRIERRSVYLLWPYCFLLKAHAPYRFLRGRRKSQHSPKPGYCEPATWGILGEVSRETHRGGKSCRREEATRGAFPLPPATKLYQLPTVNWRLSIADSASQTPAMTALTRPSLLAGLKAWPSQAGCATIIWLVESTKHGLSEGKRHILYIIIISSIARRNAFPKNFQPSTYYWTAKQNR